MIYKVVAFDKREEIDSIAGKGEKLSNAAHIHVQAKDEKEALSRAKTILKRKEYQVVEAIAEEVATTDNSNERRHREYIDTITGFHDEIVKTVKSQHKDFVQLASKSNVLSERVASALEKTANKK